MRRIAQNALSLFSVLTKASATPEHPTRVEIMRIVEAHPGIPLNKLRKRVPLAWGTLYHHVWKLSKEGKLETVVLGRRRLLFRPGEASEEFINMRNILEGRTTRQVARAITDHPRISFKRLVVVSGETERSVYYHLRRLIDARLVTSTSQTRYYGLMAAPQLVHYLARLARTSDAARGVEEDAK